MKLEPTEARLPGQLVRRIAHLVASRGTCERVLFPLLADLQFENSFSRPPSP